MNQEKTGLARCGALLWLIAVWTLALHVGAVAGEEHGHGHGGHGEEEAEHGHEEEKGAHGGKLLEEGHVSFELLLLEQGDTPEYRAWITDEGQAASDAELTVTLTRLGGQQEVFNFTQAAGQWIGQGVVKEPHSFDVQVDLRLEGHHHQWQWEAHEGRVEISEAMAQQVGITTQVAGAGQIERHLQVYGRLATPPDQKAALRARFPGLVQSVRVNVGDRVEKGTVLAVIESNESLRSYNLRAPIAGVVQERLVNVGEMVGEAPLFHLLNSERQWAELKVFPIQRKQVEPGQPVHVVHHGHVHESQIAHITATDGLPYVIARVELRNDTGDMAAGDWVSGQIDVETVKVPLVVDNRALQGFRDEQVVFIKVGDAYEVRPLALGRSDARHTEVLEGLTLGDRYVVENSYLIKADIEKAGASHEH